MHSEAGTSKRQYTHVYSLPVPSKHAGEKINVCKDMFLPTLGYSKKNDKIITSAFSENIIAAMVPIDGRGRHPPKHKIMLDDDNNITEHMSFNPVISHCRREHAPPQLYLHP